MTKGTHGRESLFGIHSFRGLEFMMRMVRDMLAGKHGCPGTITQSLYPYTKREDWERERGGERDGERN